MSLKTWKKEFYPQAPSKNMTWKQALEHSLQKWEGLSEEQLAKHNLSLDTVTPEIFEENGIESLNLSAKTCALCLKSISDPNAIYPDCSKCPLVKAQGYPCDQSPSENKISAYAAFQRRQNTVPMLELIKKALKYINRRKTK